MADLRFVLVPQFGFTLLLQAVLLELLRVDRLVRALHVRLLGARLLRTALALRPVAAVRAIAAVSATAAPAAVAAPTPMLFAFLLRRARLSIRLALRSALLLGRAGRTLVRPALALRALGLGKLALLRHVCLLAFALRAIGPVLLLLRALIAALLVAALVVAPALAAAPVAPAVAAACAPVTSAALAALAAALFVAVAMSVAHALRPDRTYHRLIGRRRLFDGFLRLQPTEQTAEKP